MLLVKRHLGVLGLTIIDGNRGIHDTLRAEWPKMLTYSAGRHNHCCKPTSCASRCRRCAAGAP